MVIFLNFWFYTYFSEKSVQWLINIKLFEHLSHFVKRNKMKSDNDTTQPDLIITYEHKIPTMILFSKYLSW